jgi:hypothetical protein
MVVGGKAKSSPADAKKSSAGGAAKKAVAITSRITKASNAKLSSSASSRSSNRNRTTTSSVFMKNADRPGGGEWNNMSHLHVKRFTDDDPTLTPGARRNRMQHPHIALIELDPSGRSKCKQCGITIAPKGMLRMGIMLECEKGYRFLCTLHEQCFWHHPESYKITWDDVLVKPGVTTEERAIIQARFAARDGRKRTTTTTKEPLPKSSS